MCAGTTTGKKPDWAMISPRWISLCLRRVLAQPESCPVEFEDIRRAALKRFPYKLLYSVETDHLYVIAVAHQHRKPGYWHDRIENS